ncbi:DUF998 domain-containing protein [Catenuloplanes sp. NPDC051500]|uniref:DUF998 domain-containing protein n=1 Tax=Catenuloplanes sp. NPDC051500 TaxID=3363959 RepID=UPI0037B90B52
MPTSAMTRAGALCWVVAAPLFLTANVVVGRAWNDPAFSWATNNVSDLGNVTCGIWDTTRPRYVCSPWHTAMNVAFILTAILLIAGLLLTWRGGGAARARRASAEGCASGGCEAGRAGLGAPADLGVRADLGVHAGLGVRAGRWLMLGGAAGLGLVGAFPADVDENIHLLAALLVFVCGNLGLVAMGIGMPRSRLRPVTVTFGVLGVSGSALFIAQQGLGLGIGGMERVAVFPLTVWACCAGVHLLSRGRGVMTAGRPGALTRA